MSQGITIKGKTASGQNVEILVDDQGRLYLNPDSVGGGSGSGLTDAELRATPVQVTDPSSEQEQEDATAVLEEIQSAIQAIASARGVSADLRVTILGGSVAITSGTITTVTTLTNQTQVGGYNANNQIPALMNVATIDSNINNVTVT